jgi:hypothetical protein
MTVLTDGDAGLRAIHRQVAPHAEHVLDWFHIAMKFTSLQQLAKVVNAVTDHGIRSHALAELNRAKWRFWNGLFEYGLIGLVHLRQWAAAQCFDHISALKKLQHAPFDVIRYLELNADSRPNYGRRYRAGQRISTGFVESAVNEIVAKRMAKKQQMRWNRRTVQSFLLNGTLEDCPYKKSNVVRYKTAKVTRTHQLFAYEKVTDGLPESSTSSIRTQQRSGHRPLELGWALALMKKIKRLGVRNDGAGRRLRLSRLFGPRCGAVLVVLPGRLCPATDESSNYGSKHSKPRACGAESARCTQRRGPDIHVESSQ